MPFTGILRKIVPVFVAPVALGWLLVVIGFGIETTPEDDSSSNTASGLGGLRYGWWMVIIGGPVAMILAIVHAAIDNNPLAMRIIGAIKSFFSALLLTSLGMLLWLYGVAIYRVESNRGRFETSLPASSSLQFSGSLIATVFWVAIECAAHFYWIPNYSRLSRTTETEMI